MNRNRIRWALPVLAGFLLAYSGIIRAQQEIRLPHLAANHEHRAE